jgi:hypothetical protein
VDWWGLFKGVAFSVITGSIAKGILLVLAKRGIRPYKWVARMIHSAPERVDSPATWIIGGVIALAVFVSWYVFNIDEKLAYLTRRSPTEVSTPAPTPNLPSPTMRGNCNAIGNNNSNCNSNAN